MRMNLLTAILMTTALTSVRSPMAYDGERIKLSYDDEAEVPAAFKALYTEKDGIWNLTGVDGMKTPTDFNKVSEALRKERNDHRVLRESLRTNLGDQYDLTAIGASIARIAELEAQIEAGSDPKNQKKIDDLVAAKVKTLTATMERELATLKTTNSTLTGEIEGFKGDKRTRAIHDAVREAGTKTKLLPEALDDALMLAERYFEVDESGAVVTKDQSGVTAGLVPTDWLTEMQEKRPHWWAPSVGGGAGGSGNKAGKNPWSAENWNMTEQGAIFNLNPARAAALAAAAGTKVGGMKPAKK